MQNLKMNVHDHMSADTMKSLFVAFSEITDAYRSHIQDLKNNHAPTAQVKAEIKRATREAKKAKDAMTLWGNRTLTKRGEEIHGRDGHYFDSDYI